MRPHDEILSLGDREALARWEAMCTDCRGTQEEVLKGISHSVTEMSLRFPSATRLSQSTVR